MYIDLGLSGIADEIIQVSLEDVLEAELEFNEIYSDFLNYANCCEIVHSVKKHSSSECMSLVEDLLGTSIETLSVSMEGFMDSLSKAWHNFINMMGRFFKWIGKQLKKLIDAISGWFRRKPKDPEQPKDPEASKEPDKPKDNNSSSDNTTESFDKKLKEETFSFTLPNLKKFTSDMKSLNTDLEKCVRVVSEAKPEFLGSVQKIFAAFASTDYYAKNHLTNDIIKDKKLYNKLKSVEETKEYSLTLKETVGVLETACGYVNKLENFIETALNKLKENGYNKRMSMGYDDYINKQVPAAKAFYSFVTLFMKAGYNVATGLRKDILTLAKFFIMADAATVVNVSRVQQMYDKGSDKVRTV